MNKSIELPSKIGSGAHEDILTIEIRYHFSFD